MWYETQFGNKTTLSSILQQIAPHLSDRANILRSIVGNPVPTEAHRSLAQLAKFGFINVFLTTNYDGLMETALYDLNLDPLVISTESEALGAEPFHQISTPVVFKLHGDYKQTESILATDRELGSYKHGIRGLLKRTLEDYGLIVCGWSGDHDAALRRAIQSTRSRRYPLWFSYREKLNVTTARLREQRQASAISVADADTFFGSLEQKVRSIESYQAPNPLGVVALTSELKWLLNQASNPLAVNEFIFAEVEKCYANFNDRERFPYKVDSMDEEEFKRRAVRIACDYVNTTMPVAHLMAIGCTWTDSHYYDIWRRALERIAQMPENEDSHSTTFLYDMRHIPWLLLLYSGTIAAIKRNNIGMVRVLCRDAASRLKSGRERVPLIGYSRPAYLFGTSPSRKALATSIVLELEGKPAQNPAPRFTPVSDALFIAAREPLRYLMPDDDDYEECFDRAEILCNMIASDVVLNRIDDHEYVPGQSTPFGPWPGRFVWRRGYWGLSLVEQSEREFRSDSAFWQAVDESLFDGDRDRRIAAMDYIKEQLREWEREGFGGY